MRHFTASMTAIALMTGTPPSRAQAIDWPMDHKREIGGSANFEPGRIDDGRFSGPVAWDPYVQLRVPAEGIDAVRLSWLTVRLYSSAPADLLDIYYGSPDDRWCLGGKLPIVKGWATYRIDLAKNRWRETQTGDASKQWGGPSRRVRSLRIDPGNQAGRWVSIDSVRLEAPPPGAAEGVTPEPRGAARLSALRSPATVNAGDTIQVEAELDIVAPAPAATLLVRLLRDKTVLRSVEAPLAPAGAHATVRVRLPVSPYWYPGTATVDVFSCELDFQTNGAPPTAAVEIRSDRVGTVQPPDVRLRPVGGDPAIFVDGRPLPGFAYVSTQGAGHHRDCARAGVHLYADWVGPTHNGDLGHVAPDRHDYAAFDRYFAEVLDADPDALFLPHIGVTGPLWWQQAHPEELCRFEDGTPGPTSFASELWRRDMGEDLRKLIAHLRRAPYADRILGYMFYNGHTAEWQMWGTWKPSRDDYSAPALRAFRAFLAKRHGTDERLRAAWADPRATLAGAEMPRWDRRRPDGPQVFRDIKTERQAIDFYEFISDMTADALLHTARIVREATGGSALVGTYYAYLTAHGINQQDSGHLAARRVFDSPDIDFLMSPPNYWYRRPGEAATFMSATDSFRLRGKLWLDESDHRTHLSDPGAGYGRAANLPESLGVFWREFAEVLTKRAAVSWFDMGGGWFADPAIMDAMRRANTIMAEGLPRRKPFAAQIGVFVDPQSFHRMRSTTANAALDLHQVVTLPQSGAPWDFLLLDDIADPRLPDYKLYILLNAFCIDPARRAAIHAKLKRNGATALFLYAPGYLDADGAALDGMKALTGIRLGIDPREGRPRLLLAQGDPLAEGLSPATPIGADRLVVAPLFHADDPDARVAGRLVDSHRPALAVKRAAGWTSIYSAAMPLPQGLVRNIARSAGVHVWLDTDDALYTDGQFAGIHAAADGTKILRLPEPRTVTDAITGKRLAAHAREIALPMKRAETVLLRLDP